MRMSDEKLTAIFRRALLDDGPEGENAWRILKRQVDPHSIKLVQPKSS